MKNTKKIVSLILAICMIASLAISASAANTVDASGGTGTSSVTLSSTADGSLDGDPSATTKWSVGEYNRLSKEDGDKPESDSIQNQHSINQKHLEYLREHGEQIESVTVYSDDGYAGGSFNRPRYQDMIRDIERGKINCIIFKDYCAIIGLNQKDLENQGILA